MGYSKDKGGKSFFCQSKKLFRGKEKTGIDVFDKYFIGRTVNVFLRTHCQHA
jgi:hypothetical protein